MTIKDVLMNYHSPCTTTTSKISSPEMSHTFQPEACIRKPWVRRRAGIINSATDPSRTSSPIDGWTSGLGSCGNTLDQIHQRVWKWPSQRTTCHDRPVRPVLVDSKWWKWARENPQPKTTTTRSNLIYWFNQYSLPSSSIWRMLGDCLQWIRFVDRFWKRNFLPYLIIIKTWKEVLGLTQKFTKNHLNCSP